MAMIRYSKNVNPRLIAYCKSKAYATVEERWEKDGHSNHPFTQWLDVEWKLFDQNVLGNVGYPWRQIYGEEFDIWLKGRYPDLD
jgi:hypothetical protein